MSLLLPARSGALRPRYLTSPPYKTSAGPEVVALAESTGLYLDPWQQEDLNVALGEREDGKWSAFEVAIIVGRQNGKNAVLEARQLAGLFLFGEKLQTHTAHRVDTCLEHFRRIKERLEATPDLSRRVRKITETNGAEAIELMTGERLIFKARSKGSGRGFSGSVVYLDEAYYLFDLGAMLPTMSAQSVTGNPQLWYSSSAPSEKDESAILRRLCKRGRAGTSPRLAYMEYAAAPDTASDDREGWSDANPGLGIRIAEEFIEGELEAMDDLDFRRERLGIWIDPDDEEGPDHVLGREAWGGCLDTSSAPGEPVRLALDVSVDRKWAAFGVAGPSEAGTHIELADYRPGTDWVVSRAVELQARWGGPLFIAEKSPAAKFIEALHEVEVEVREVSTEEHSQACAHLFDEVQGRRVRHLGDPVLDGAVRAAEKRFYGDESWLWSRRTSTGDICPLVAVTLAAWALGLPVEGDAGFIDIDELLEEDTA